MAKYFYNGIELPALPEFDSTTYPYALIFYYETCGYVFAVGNKAKTVNTEGKVTYNIYDTRLLYKLVDGVWTSFSIVLISGVPAWSNHDILNADGTIYLAATDPVPVLSWADKTPYRRMNGQWVKQDTYKRVNGEWVKQDEYRRE